MQALLQSLTPNWRGKLTSTSDGQAASRLNKVVSIKSVVRGRLAHYRELHEKNAHAIAIFCGGEYYELERL